MSDEHDHTILLIEEDTSLRRLMALGLQYRGMQTIEASSSAHLSEGEGRQPAPALVVIDVDGGTSSDRSLLAAVQSHPYLSTLPILVLAWEDNVPESTQRQALQQPIVYLAKPFDARTLHATIEQMLATSTARASEPAVALTAHVPPLSADHASPAPSIWPLVTAAGLLLAFVGLLGPVAITGVGLVIFLAALLLWTLGTKPEHTIISSQEL